jgi:hypothetical protein
MGSDLSIQMLQDVLYEKGLKSYKSHASKSFGSQKKKINLNQDITM